MCQPKFGPAGNSESFYSEGYKHTYEMPAWLEKRGLEAFEYSFGRGVRLNQDTAEKIAAEADAHGITLSVHAPYFINLAAPEPEKFEKNIGYFKDSAQAARYLGAKRIIFHPGSCSKVERGVALEIALEHFKTIIGLMDEWGYGDMSLCPETMGKINQLGDLGEVMELCKLDERVVPTIDFGHLHTRGLGAIQSKQDYVDILTTIENTLGRERLKYMHVHFSRIEYTKGGEKRHWTFADTQFGPDFEPLGELLAEWDLCPTVICESSGTMAEDAAAMKKMYLEAKLAG